jgi:transcriptional regulator NrdR family protein
MFEVNSEKYSRYEEARANHWRCDKCGNRFSTFKKLRKHKKDIHAY